MVTAAVTSTLTTGVRVVVCWPVQLAPWLAAEVPHLVDGGFITAS